MKDLLFALHKWAALVVGFFIFCAASSGAVLVFEGAIDRGLHPSLWRVTPGAAALPIDTVAARVAAAFPGKEIGAISPTKVADRAWTVGAGELTVFVDPYTGHVNGTRTRAEQQQLVSRRIHLFHVALLAGPVGSIVVVVATGCALFLVLTGIILWWSEKLVRIHASASWKRINFDLHHAFGIVAAVVLLVITTTGVIIPSNSFGNVMRSLDRASPPTPPVQAPAPAGTPALGWGALVAAGERALPGADIMFLDNGDAKHPAVLAMRFPEDHTPGGRSRVFVNRYTGAVLLSINTREAGFFTSIDNVKRSLHTGDIMGRPTEVIWLLAAIVLASQFVTGVLMWWNARPARQRD